MASRRQLDQVVPPRRVKLRKPVMPEDMVDAGLRRAAGETLRCEWAQRNPDLTLYHDDVWGEPPADDREYFERMMLEIFHAGLSWTVIWNKRNGLRRAYDAFDIDVGYGPAEVTRLMDDPVVRSAKKSTRPSPTRARCSSSRPSTATWRHFCGNCPTTPTRKILADLRAWVRAWRALPIPPPHHPYCYKAARRLTRRAAAP